MHLELAEAAAEANLLGVVFDPRGIMTAAPYRVIDSKHWAFAGTGLRALTLVSSARASYARGPTSEVVMLRLVGPLAALSLWLAACGGKLTSPAAGDAGGDVGLGQHDVALGQIFRQPAHFYVRPLANDDGMKAVAHKRLHRAVRDVDERASGLQHVQAAPAHIYDFAWCLNTHWPYATIPF